MDMRLYELFTKKEKDSALNILCRGAALRYLLTRIYDYFNTPKTATNSGSRNLTSIFKS